MQNSYINIVLVKLVPINIVPFILPCTDSKNRVTVSSIPCFEDTSPSEHRHSNIGTTVVFSDVSTRSRIKCDCKKFSMEHEIYIKVEPMPHNQDTRNVTYQQGQNGLQTECFIKNDPETNTVHSDSRYKSTSQSSDGVSMHQNEVSANDERGSLPVNQLDTFRAISRPTEKQVVGLVEFLEQNPGIAKGIMRSAYAKHSTKKKWNEIATTLNAIGGAQKDGKGWAKYWADKKFALKKACYAMRQTAGPGEALPTMSPIDQRLVGVMGGQESAGDGHGITNPTPTRIPTSSQPVSTKNKDVLLAIESSTVAVDPACNNSMDQLALDAQESEDCDTVPLQNERERSPLRTPTASRRRPRTKPGSLNEDRNRFAAIEQRRVEAETITAEALRNAAQNVSSVANAINNLATSVKEAAQILAQAIRSTHPPNTT